jgi:hypothetical protein
VSGVQERDIKGTYMRSLLTILPVVIVLVTLLFTVIRHIGRVWLEYRVKLELLRKLERHPEVLGSFKELQTVVEGNSSEPEVESWVDFRITGVILAVIGAIFVVMYAMAGHGRWAVGAYWGGVICIALGFLMVVVGLVLHHLTHIAPQRGVPDDKPQHR